MKSSYILPFLKWRHHYKYYYEEPVTINEVASSLQKVNRYPNPATALNVDADYSTAQADRTAVMRSDISGKTLFPTDEATSTGDHSVMIPVGGLSQGIYRPQNFNGARLKLAC